MLSISGKKIHWYQSINHPINERNSRDIIVTNRKGTISDDISGGSFCLCLCKKRATQKMGDTICVKRALCKIELGACFSINLCSINKRDRSICSEMARQTPNSLVEIASGAVLGLELVGCLRINLSHLCTLELRCFNASLVEMTLKWRWNNVRCQWGKQLGGCFWINLSNSYSYYVVEN
jgi:hypothetical protein